MNEKGRKEKIMLDSYRLKVNLYFLHMLHKMLFILGVEVGIIRIMRTFCKNLNILEKRNGAENRTYFSMYNWKQYLERGGNHLNI